MQRLRRLFTALALLLGAVTVIPLFSGIASAHHSNIDASVACSGTVSWTASSWATGSAGTNPDVRVFYKVGNNSPGNHNPLIQIGQGQFNAANNYRFAGTMQWPNGANQITVSSQPFGQWGNGNTSHDGSSITISKPSNCPGQPGASKAVSCSSAAAGHGDGTVVITLTNDAGPWAGSVQFKVYAPDQTSSFTTHNVANGATNQLTFGGLADGSHFVKITSGQQNLTQNFTIDCDSAIPSSSLVVVCANGDGRVTVTLSNTGGEPVVFDVTDPNSQVVEHVTVAADSSTTRTFSGFADGDYTVVIKVGQTDYSLPFTIDCDHPAPKVSSSVTCGSDHDGAVTITLTNDGTEAVTFHVTDPITNVVEDIDVAAGASTTRSFTGLDDGMHTIAIAADGQDLTQTVAIECDLPASYSTTEDCSNGDGVLTVTLSNDGDDTPVVFVVEGIEYVVAPGSSAIATLAGLADGPHHIAVTIDGTDQSFDIVVDCDRPGEPAVELTTFCADEDGTVVVTLKNLGGQLPLTFLVEGTPYDVPANSSVDVTLSGHNDGWHTVTISQDGVDMTRPFFVGCDLPPTVTVAQTCADGANGVSDGQVTVTLHNNGDDVAVTFTVEGVDHTVAPKQSADVTIGGLTDGTHHIAVLAGTTDLSVDVDVSCDHPGVASIQVAERCADNDGVIVVTLIATGGELPITFTVDGTAYLVQPDTTRDVEISGLADGTTVVQVLADQQDLSFERLIACDLPPKVSYVQACSGFDDTVTVTVENQGDDRAVTFTINGVDHVVSPGQSQNVLVGGLADGTNTITVAIDGVAQESIVVESHCDPVFAVTAVCNSVDVNGDVTSYWFTVTNSEAADLTVSWDGGSATVAAGQSVNVASTHSQLVLTYGEAEIARADAAESTCTRDVTITKELLGHPATPETYSVRISRLVGETYQPVATVELNAGESKTVTLPSTLDPAGVDYKVEEIVSGTASTSTVSPDGVKLSGHLGETISVVVTNGYASVQIDKTASATSIVAGGQLTYTLQVTNTGGLTLAPVVVTDRLPAAMSLVSAAVSGSGGDCVLAQSTRPQLVSCSLNAALAPGAVAPSISVTVKLDAGVIAGTALLNQAMVHGAFASVSGLATTVNGANAAGAELSCAPAIASTVCDLSAKVGTTVAEVAQEPPTGTVSSPVAQLPRTGAGHVQAMLAVACGVLLLGGVLLFGRRRIGAR